MSTPVIQYNSAGIPIGPGVRAAAIIIWRPPITTDSIGTKLASVVPYGSEASGVQVGLATNFENLSLSLSGKEVERTGQYNEALGDGSITRENPKMTCEAFIASLGSADVMIGDYFNINVGYAINSTAATPVVIAASRWKVMSVNRTTTGANKFSLSLSLDRVNSSPNLVEF